MTRAHRRIPRLEWPFAQQCARAVDLNDLTDLLAVEFARLGFAMFCCCSHVRPDRPVNGAVFLQNYPHPWVMRYKQRHYFRRDPVFAIGRTFVEPFAWSDPRFLALLEPDQLAIVEDAAAHGLRYGVTIPLHGPRRYSASCSLISQSADIDGDKVYLAQRYALTAYEAARDLVGPDEDRPRIQLSRRERQCLELVALGKSDEEIGFILGIDAATAHGYIESAKQRLNAMKRTQAVAYAIYTEAINLEDVFGV